MGARAVAVKQADISRAVRAMKAAGVPAVRIVIERDRVVIEPKEPREAPTLEPVVVAGDEIVELI